MTSVLDKIIATKREEVAAAKQLVSEKELYLRLEDQSAPRDFFSALNRGGRMRLIAEVKKASPSQGVLRADFDPAVIAQAYEKGGADCLSVLTDVHYFQGSLDYLRDVRSSTSLPALRKDFVIDPYQILEARAAGADAVLLIAECLDNCRLRQFYGMVIDLGMTPLIELYEPENLDRVLETGTNLIGINNRNLRNFEVSLDHTLRLRERIPPEILLVSESGIHSPLDVQRLFAAGVSAMLVGEHFMRQANIESAVKHLLGTEHAC
jgi:indole-3-glycerol phosphate synthase